MVPDLMKRISLAPDVAVLHYFEQLRSSTGWSHYKFHSLTARDWNLLPLYFYHWFIALCPLCFHLLIHVLVLSEWENVVVGRTAGSGIGPPYHSCCLALQQHDLESLCYEKCSFSVLAFSNLLSAVLSKIDPCKLKLFMQAFKGTWILVCVTWAFIRSQLTSFHLGKKNHSLKRFLKRAGFFPSLFVYMFVTQKISS